MYGTTTETFSFSNQTVIFYFFAKNNYQISLFHNFHIFYKRAKEEFSCLISAVLLPVLVFVLCNPKIIFSRTFQSDLCHIDGYCVYDIVASKTLYIRGISTITAEKYGMRTAISILYGHSRKVIYPFLRLFAVYLSRIKCVSCLSCSHKSYLILLNSYFLERRSNNSGNVTAKQSQAINNFFQSFIVYKL